MKRTAFLALLLAVVTQAFSQSRNLQGTVLDKSSGDPLPGVTVRLGNTSNGTQTDGKGHFRLQVPDSRSYTLEFSYIGYLTRTVHSDGKKHVDVQLTANPKLMNEVVVVGYGSVNRRDLTASVSSVTSKQLKDIPVNSAEEALAGRLAGVQITGSEGSPDAQVSIRVRGGGSITQDNSPLYVVDGVIMDNALSTLSPQDIKSIDVLKDASATAIYGARGANGVVIITTKGGTPGKLRVNYNGYVGFQKVEKELPVMNPYQFVMYQYERSRGSSQLSQTFQDTYGNFQDLSLYKNAPFVNWQDQVFGRPAFMQTHNISLSGGDKKTTFNLSLTDNQDQAVMMNSDYDRKLVNFRMANNVSSKLKTGFNLRFNDQIVNGAGTSSPGSSGLNFLRQAVRYIPYLAPGQSVAYYDPNLLNETIANGLYIVNPVLLANQEYKRQYQTVIGLSGYANYSLTRFLSFRTTVGYDYYSQSTNSYDDSLTSNAISNGNGLPIATVQGNLRQTLDNSNVFTFSNSKLKGAFNKDNSINVILGQESYQAKSKGSMQIQRYFPLGTTAEKALGNLNLASPPTGYAEPSPTSSEDVQRILSFFGRVNYGFKDKYLASIAMRADGSSVFAPGRQWGYFPAASFAWRISKEPFMQNLKSVISDAKLRLSYGEAGNNRIQSFLYLTEFETGSNYYGLQNQLVTAFASSSLANSLLTWEANVSRDAGLDVSLFNNRVNVSLDYYRNKTRNLLVAVPVPTTSGYTTQIQNVGATSNNGFEAQVNTAIMETKNFSWSANFNISFNNNKVLSLGRQQSFLVNSGWAGSNNPFDFIIKVGAPVGSMYGLVNDGYYTVNDFNYNKATGAYTLKQGVPDDHYVTALTPQPGMIKYKDLNGDGKVDQSDRTIIGNANPRFFGGLNQQFTYKNFDMSVFINFQYGNNVVNDNKLEFASGYTPNANLLSIMNNRWKTVDAQGNVVTDPSQLAAMNQNAQYWIPVTSSSAFYPQSWAIENGSFARLNNVTLGYSLPASITRKMKIERLRAYVTLNNLYVLTNYSGYDPEVNTRRGTPMTPGVDYSAYPRSKSYIFGVNLTF